MKQTTKVNFAQSRSTGSGGISLRGGSSLRARGGRGGHGQSRFGRGGDSSTTGGTSGGVGGPSAGSSTSNQNNSRCNACNYHHIPGQCPHANLECLEYILSFASFVLWSSIQLLLLHHLLSFLCPSVPSFLRFFFIAQNLSPLFSTSPRSTHLFYHCTCQDIKEMNSIWAVR